MSAASPYYTAEHEAFRDQVRRFVATEITPNIDAWDEAETFPRELYRKTAELGFLGLGLPPPDPDWGGMVNETRQMAMVFPHMTLFPCIAISSLILGFNLLADGLREISLRD